MTRRQRWVLKISFSRHSDLCRRRTLWWWPVPTTGQCSEGWSTNWNKSLKTHLWGGKPDRRLRRVQSEQPDPLGGSSWRHPVPGTGYTGASSQKHEGKTGGPKFANYCPDWLWPDLCWSVSISKRLFNFFCYFVLYAESGRALMM